MLTRTNSELNRLSAIAEDSDAPALPRKAAHRPASRRFGLGLPPRHDHESPPPPYTSFADVLGPNGEKFSDVRNNKHIARRGGWKRLCIIGFVVAAVLVGLVVGLAVGLHHKSSKSDVPPAASPSASPNTQPTGPFPVGSYSLTTFLDTVNTNCTSNSNTWRCFPYSTYEQSASQSEAVFNWIISSPDGGSKPTNFTISSTDNPFSIGFTNISLQLWDKGMDSERYAFQMPMDKPVSPSAPITNDNSNAICYFNRTTLQTYLYTRKGKTYPPASSTSTSSTVSSDSISGYQPWPYAVKIEQVILGGADVPECYKKINGNTGDRITTGLAPKRATDQCSCLYQNFELPTS
ncbi:MAG: hypothetical protein M1812_003463 [Candelaria pacifica]|nr:MAG: hypothetical protein M1812_003463 [Candelaria pacifica]